jgi:hypothetical protein
VTLPLAMPPEPARVEQPAHVAPPAPEPARVEQPAHVAPPAPPMQLGPAAPMPPQYDFEPSPFINQRRPWPLLGATLATYGGLLWSYVIAGQFTTSWMSGAPMNEGTAILIVLIATSLVFAFALRRSRVASPVSPARMFGRAVGTFCLTGLAFFVTLLVATIAGESSYRSRDVPIAFVLVALAVIATAFAPRVTLGTAATARPSAPTHGRRVAEVLLWVSLAVVTLVAGAELVANG